MVAPQLVSPIHHSSSLLTLATITFDVVKSREKKAQNK